MNTNSWMKDSNGMPVKNIQTLVESKSMLIYSTDIMNNF
jgi:hypothetical protein